MRLLRVPLAVALNRQCFQRSLASEAPRQWHPRADMLSHVFDMNSLNQAQLEANDFRLLKQAIDERMEEPSAQAGRP